MLTRLSSPVIYRDLVMEKLHFPDTRVGMEPIIPKPQVLRPTEVVLNPGCTGRSGGPTACPSLGRMPQMLGCHSQRCCPRLATAPEEITSIQQ